LQCNRRFTTYERIEFVPITVIKRDGNRESFDRSKLLRGMIRACEKTGVSSIQLEKLVDDIESDLQQQAMREVPSHEIGELVLQSLRQVSEVAYIRFASVYRKFQGIRDFVDTLDHLQGCLVNDFNRIPDSAEIPLDVPTIDTHSAVLSQTPKTNRLN